MAPKPIPPLPPVKHHPRVADYAAYGGTPASARDQIGALGPALPNMNPSVGDTVIWDGSNWVPGAGGGGGFETFVTRSMTIPSVFGAADYRIPVGLWFKQGSATTLTINGNEQQYGADYSHIGRYSTPPTVADTCFGFHVSGGLTPLGWTLTFTWSEGHLSIHPPTVTLQRLVNLGAGWQPDFTQEGNPWSPSSVTLAPNGVSIPTPPAPYVVEFWRETTKRGGTFLTPNGGHVFRSGRRYVPYFRGPSTQSVDPNTFYMSEFSSARARPWQKLRVCYYNPLTGARSALSAETIVVIGTASTDQIRTYGVGMNPAHVAGSVMIKR